jgi:antitoxin component HigA of HigAB toxin-antitoxin module
MEGGFMKKPRGETMKLSGLPSSYVALMAAFPLLPIKNAKDYQRAAKNVHRLAMQEGRLDAGQEAYLEVLEGLVERYDATHSEMNADDVSPTEALRVLVEQAGMSVSELGTLLGSKGAASELLSGNRREPSKGQIAKLCKRFKVDAGLFLLGNRGKADAA